MDGLDRRTRQDLRVLDFFERVPGWLRAIGVFTLFLFGYGLFVSIFYGGPFFPFLEQGRDERWSWWQYVLTIPAIGLAALGLEAVGSAIIAFIEKRAWLVGAIRFVFKAILVVLLVALIGVFGLLAWEVIRGR